MVAPQGQGECGRRLGGPSVLSRPRAVDPRCNDDPTLPVILMLLGELDLDLYLEAGHMTQAGHGFSYVNPGGALNWNSASRFLLRNSPASYKRYRPE